MSQAAKAPTPTTIHLVGGGLVGSLLSIYLARRGFEVELFERRPDMRKEPISAGRSINLAISARGIHALKQLGIDQEILSHATPMRGRMVHSLSGDTQFQRYGKDDTQAIHSISRGYLNQALLTHAEHTGRVRIHFNQRCTAYHFASRTLSFTDERTGQQTQVTAATTIGTDGSASAIREALNAHLGQETSYSPLAHGYKELTIESGSEGSFKMEKNALHIWPRGHYMLIGLPNEDGSFTCTLFLPFEGSPSFESLRSSADIRSFFETQFKDSVPLISQLSEEFLGNPTGQMVTVKLDQWCDPNGQVLLVGDAAHAIVPFFGQGMNCGFEDCTVLDDLLSNSGPQPQWSQIFAQFNELRKTNSDAIADMAVENFIEMRDKVAQSEFLLQKAIEKRLQQEFGEDYTPRYSLVSFSQKPYRYAYNLGVAQQKVLDRLAQGKTSADQIDLGLARRLVEDWVLPVVRRG